MAGFVHTCRDARKLLHLPTLAGRGSDIFTDEESYTMQELADTVTGKYPRTLVGVVEALWVHVKHCTLCQGRGYHCEVCIGDDLLFAFMPQASVLACQECGSCFHTDCFHHVGSCPRCARIARRRKPVSDQDLTDLQ
jgi:hypothetical protein